ncbi:MAG: CYTH domain-containing protein [Chloroflexota bacterium]|nr:CYTH domain-containing protein [Chloroflexota bacterium]
MIEVELKYEVPHESQRRVQEYLQQRSFRGVVENRDTYYDTSTFALLQQAVFVRVRNHTQLQFKFNERADKAHAQSHEYVFPMMPDATEAQQINALFRRFLPHWQTVSDVEQAISINDLLELARIENTREQYVDDEMSISFDHVAGLGDFLELEIQGDDDMNTQQALTRLYAIASRLQLPPMRIGYVELWLRRYNMHAYQLGKYRQEKPTHAAYDVPNIGC